MRQALLAGVLALVLAGCGGGTESKTESTAAAPTGAGETTSVTAGGCTASGLDAMTALADFQLKMGDAQKAGEAHRRPTDGRADKLY